MTAFAFIFPGQGAQQVGMGRCLYERFPTAKQIFSQANDILGFNLTRVCFQGPEDELKQTRLTQPAIFVHSVVVAQLLKENGYTPFMAAGHSLGEYSALVAAEAMKFETALQVVKERGQQMQKAGALNPGTMAAIVGLDFEVIQRLCQEAANAGIVQPANFNSPGQVVISGSIAGVHRAMDLARESGAKRVVELEVSGAFHSPLMQTASAGLNQALAAAEIGPARVPIYANVTAKPVTEAGVILELLKQQLTHPVRWCESVENMIADGALQFIEAGPGNVLTGLLKRINRTVKCRAIGTAEQLVNFLEGKESE